MCTIFGKKISKVSSIFEKATKKICSSPVIWPLLLFPFFFSFFRIISALSLDHSLTQLSLVASSEERGSSQQTGADLATRRRENKKGPNSSDKPRFCKWQIISFKLLMKVPYFLFHRPLYGTSGKGL